MKDGDNYYVRLLFWAAAGSLFFAILTGTIEKIANRPIPMPHGILVREGSDSWRYIPLQPGDLYVPMDWEK